MYTPPFQNSRIVILPIVRMKPGSHAIVSTCSRYIRVPVVQAPTRHSIAKKYGELPKVTMRAEAQGELICAVTHRTLPFRRFVTNPGGMDISVA